MFTYFLCVFGIGFSGQETTGQYLTWDIPPAEVPVGFFLEVAAAEG